MSLKLFLKIYARLVAIAAAVVVVCILLFSVVNSVREQIWHETTAEPLMQWLAAVPHPDTQYHWMSSMFGLQAGSPDSFELSPVTAERLSYGQVVGQEVDAGYRFFVLAGDGRLIRLRLKQPHTDLARATALIARWHLDSAPAEQRAAMAPQLEQSLKVKIAPVQDPSQLPDQSVLDGLQGNALVPFQGRDNRSKVLFRLASGDLWLMDMPSGFNPWGWPVILLLAVVLGGVLAFALFLGLRFVDGQMRKVESVAVRMARGEMSARVEAGEGTVVSRLAASFNSMAEQIQRLVDVQREMIHAVSHELRTPVARIRFGVQMIESANSP